jgi:hypothetical protein
MGLTVHQNALRTENIDEHIIDMLNNLSQL